MLNYDTWKSGWNDIYCESPTCRKCEETEQKMDRAADFLLGVIEILYSKEKLDHLELERYMDELCFHLGIREPKGDLQIQRCIR